MLRTLAIAMPLAALALSVDAHSGVQDPQVKARMIAMADIAAQTKVIGTMAKGEAAFDADEVEAALGRLARLAREIPEEFEPQATDPKSEARPTIWTNWDDFTNRAEDLAEVAASLKVEEPGDLRQALATLGGTCKSCHADYRE